MPTKLIGIWGKGGVGKTTVSLAISRSLSAQGLKLLYLATDVAHPVSLQGMWDCKGEGEKIECGENMEALILGEEEVKRMWVKRFGKEVYEVASSFFPVEDWIIDYVAGAPGIADEFIMYYVWELWKNGTYDIIVWDTAAAGESIRLLRLEKEFYEHLGEATRVYLRVKGSLEKIRRGRGDPLELINSWRNLANDVLKLLASDSNRSLIVLEPGAFSISVTDKILRELGSHGIPVSGLLINKVIASSRCPGCVEMENIGAEQKEQIKIAEERWGSELEMCIIPFIANAEAKPEKIIDEVSHHLEVNCEKILKWI
jgi:arsenite-transporting ATPase